MNSDRTDGWVAIAAALLVLFSAMWDPDLGGCEPGRPVGAGDPPVPGIPTRLIGLSAGPSPLSLWGSVCEGG